MKETLKSKTDRATGINSTGHRILQIVASLLIASTAVTWFWSTAAADVFGAPAIRFSDAFAGSLALFVLAYGCGAAFGAGRSRHDT